MTSNEIKMGCLLFLIIMASKHYIPERILKKYPKLGPCIEITGAIVITVVAFFALKKY